MKKVLFWAFAALLMTGFTACNSDEPENNNNNNQEQDDQQDDPQDDPQAVFTAAEYSVWLGSAGGWDDQTAGNYTLTFNGSNAVFTDNHNGGTANCWKTQLKINSDPAFAAASGKTLKVSYTINPSNEVTKACLKVADFTTSTEVELCSPFQFGDGQGTNTTNEDGAATVTLPANTDTAISFEKALTADYANITLILGLNGGQGTVYTISNISVTVE